MRRVPITLAVAHYDRHVPFLEGSVVPDGVDLDMIEVGHTAMGRHGTGRHRRMLRDGEFEACEISFSSYLMAVARGLPFTGIPVVPRRLFSQSLLYTRVDSPLTGPGDLVGRRVGVNTYQTTLSVLAKGDLQHAHGVPWKEITWVINHDETIPFDPPPDVRIERADTTGRKVYELLLDGELDALLIPHPPRHLTEGEPRIRRLFPDPRAAEVDYFRRFGYWPIMHFVILRNDVAERHPWLPRSLYDAWLAAKERLADYWADPNWSSLAWAPQYREEERAIFGDPWTHGLAANRANIERFVAYSHEQGLIPDRLAPERLFHESLLDT